jgi:hypothetical protein
MPWRDKSSTMMDQPFFDRWRAKLIANLEPGSVGELDTIRFAQVAATVAVVCPFLRFDGEPCELLITYYLQVGSGVEDDLSYALGACHRHLGHAFDVLFTADRIGLPDACDDDAVDASAPAPPARPPALADDTELAGRLLAGGTVTAVDFGTTALHEGYPIVSGARVTFAAHITQRLRDSGVLELAGDLGIDVAADETGSVTLVTPMPDGAEEWISQNCALRELVSDVLENAVDPIGYCRISSSSSRASIRARAVVRSKFGRASSLRRPNARGRARSKPTDGKPCTCSSIGYRAPAIISM